MPKTMGNQKDTRRASDHDIIKNRIWASGRPPNTKRNQTILDFGIVSEYEIILNKLRNWSLGATSEHESIENK